MGDETHPTYNKEVFSFHQYYDAASVPSSSAKQYTVQVLQGVYTKKECGLSSNHPSCNKEQ